LRYRVGLEPPARCAPVKCCGLDNVAFDGALDAGNLHGTLKKREFSGVATKTLSEDTLERQTTDIANPTRTVAIRAG
jgi:hypothetical protein